MSRHIQTAAFTAVLLVFALTLTETASAQLVALRHHSTILGDHFSGASELVRARGAFLRDEADAAETWVRVAAATDDLWYQRSERAYQVKRMRLEYIEQKAAMNRERQELETAAEENAALRLLQTAQRGVPQWPAALEMPKFATSMTTIESLLRNWSPEDTTGDAYRRALATEAGVLRTRIAGDKSIDHASRVAAVQTLERLQLLATLPGTGAVGGQQLALR
jgi:hypothetical protein